MSIDRWMDKDVVYVCIHTTHTHTHTHVPMEYWKKVKVLFTQSCPALCHSMDCSLPRSSINRILQARILEQVPTSFYIQLNTCLLAKLLQSCPTLCDPIDSSPPGSPVPGILQARTLEWVAISFSNTWKWKVKVKLLSRVWLLATPWTVAHQAPPSMGFSRQEYWSRVPSPSPNWILLHYK